MMNLQLKIHQPVKNNWKVVLSSEEDFKEAIKSSKASQV